MGNPTVTVLTEGMWASLTGGWYYDKKQSHFSNLFHLYIWLIFLSFPLVNYLFFNTWFSWFIYCLFIGFIFTVIKIINEYFHRIFDTGKCIKDETTNSYQEPNALNSLMCNDGEFGEKETLEMVTISNNSQTNNDNDSKITKTDQPNSISVPIEQADDNCSNEITSKTIDLKADVHCNDTDSSFGNLSLLFKNDDESRKIETNDQNDLSANKNLDGTIVSGSDASISFITTIYTKENSSNNSISVLDNLHKNEQMVTFRRARSEIETVKDKSRSTTTTELPSHPVSLEIINSKSDKKEKNVPLDKNRFNKNENEIKIKYNKPKGFLIDENETPKMGRIEEMIEKMAPVSTYLKKDCDSSEDGDESEISLYTGDSKKLKFTASKKLPKQINRKTRINNRRRSKSSTGRSDWLHKAIYHELDQRAIKPNIVLVNTSDDDYSGDKTSKHGNNYSNRFQFHSDSSSLPSSSSSSSITSIKKIKDMEQFPINYPSTSKGIRVCDKKRFQSFSSKLQKYSQNCELLERDLAKHFEKTRKQQSHTSEEVDNENFKYFYNSERKSRSNSIRDGESLKNSVVCLQGSSTIIDDILSTPGTHLATSHEDTTSGAVHVFQDERGNWFTYTFDDNSTGMARGLCPQNPFSKLTTSDSIEKLISKSFYMKYPSPSPVDSTTLKNSTNSNEQNLESNINKLDSLVLFNGQSHTPDLMPNYQRNIVDGIYPNYDPNSDRCLFFDVSMASDFISTLNNASFTHSFQRSQQQMKPSQYYNMNILNVKTIKIHFDRLALLAFLDRNLTIFELISSILLAVLVAIFSSILLSKDFFHDIRLVIFCFVVAGSQYTLLKSVQPDAASPTHGFNRIAIYSRPIYFCLVSLIILISTEYYHLHSMDDVIFEIYGLNLINHDLFLTISNVSQTFILIFPLLFMFGLLPQCNTFVMYTFEHIDIHLFGGTASTMGMISATYSIIRSLLAIVFLYLCAQLFCIKETQRASFSVFCGILASVSYLFSRSPSDPSLMWNIIIQCFKTMNNFFNSPFNNFKSKQTASNINVSSELSPKQGKAEDSADLIDPLPEKLKKIAFARFESDFISCIFVAITVFSVHVSSIFRLQPFFNDCITIIVVIWSLILHYFIPQFRKQWPWQFLSSPICKSYEFNKFEVKAPAKNMWFEKVQVWIWLIEKNILYPLLFLGYITTDCSLFIKTYGHNFGLLLMIICGFKCLRSTFNDPSHNYIIVLFTYLFFSYDIRILIIKHDNIHLLNYFIMSILFYKIEDFLLKFRFVMTYVAPWQITWGSAFHAFAQPFSVPHSALLFVQIFVSSIFSSPLQPILGSAIFFTSYVRPIKFWERDYNTKRVDHSNTRLAAQIEKTQIGSDDNNLNSIFYEHLTRSLQHSLYGDLILGRWGNISQGDCFVLASDNLNCLVHIIELGNGFVTFQVRGLEFRGTYCQQREVEAITENVSDDDGCCCCEPSRPSGVLSGNAAFNQRWLSWEVTHTNYVLEGYSISEHIASTILQPYDLRKALITFYIKSIIYFCITDEQFPKWIENEDIKESLSYLNEKNFVDLDPTFNYNIDEDYDIMSSGITRTCFKSCYLEWIHYCIENSIHASKMEMIKKNEEFVISLCLGLSLLARRALGTASHHNSALMNVEFFLYGFHALFKGDFRIHCSRDEWVFQDMDFLNKVVSPSVRMSLKLHQDQFINCEEYEDLKNLFHSISKHQKSMVISHEADPIWRKAILSNVPSLLALRHVFDEGTDQYKVIMLNKRFLNFRIIKINRECVRGLWAGQQQELIFLRNRNPERGSIQNAKQVLRNIINSSCDQPIGYPIYVSPLTTSFFETSAPLSQIIGPSLSFSIFKRAFVGFFNKIRNRCNEVCSTHSHPNELNFSASRLAKSESTDRGIDDSTSAKGSLIASNQSQIVQFSNYNQSLKKRIIKNDDQLLHNSTLVNLPSNKNVIAMLQNLPNEQSLMHSSGSKPPPIAAGQSETSFINLERSRSLIIEKGLAHTKGDAV